MDIVPYQTATRARLELWRSLCYGIADHSSHVWIDELSHSFTHLFNHPELDLDQESSDGGSLIKFYRENDPKAPHPFRQYVIVEFDKPDLDENLPDAPRFQRRPSL